MLSRRGGSGFLDENDGSVVRVSDVDSGRKMKMRIVKIMRRLVFPTILGYLTWLAIHTFGFEFTRENLRFMYEIWAPAIRFLVLWLGVPFCLAALAFWLDQKEGELSKMEQKVKAGRSRRICMENWRTCGHCRTMNDGNVTFGVCDKRRGLLCFGRTCPNAPVELENG
jgi:hypothetical protein